MLQKIHRRYLIWLTGLISFAGVVVILVGLMVLRDVNRVQQAEPSIDQPIQTPTHQITHQQITGLKQYNLAKEVAVTWAVDATLINASSRWPKLTSISQIGEPTDWSYHFYSPTLKRKLFVTVTPDGKAQMFPHPVPVGLPLQTIMFNQPMIDSPVVLAVWLDRGGEKMLHNNLANLDFELITQLRYDKHFSSPVWLVVGLNPQTRETHSVIIRATDGAVLQ
jgi:hypothetical protein